MNPNGGIYIAGTDNRSEVIPPNTALPTGSVEEPTFDNNIFVGWRLPNNTVISTETLKTTVFAIDTEVVAVWEEDANDDKIADIYQTQVIYKIVNGTWDGVSSADITEWITFRDNEGNPSVAVGSIGEILKTPTPTPTPTLEVTLPQTGDSSNAYVWIGLMALAVVGIIISKKKKEVK